MVRLMDKRYIDEHHVVARYLADRVTDEERSEFETYYLEHPEVVLEMEAAARFKVGLMRLREDGDLAGLLRPKPFYQQWQLIAAAAVVVMIVLGAIYEFTRPASSPPLIAASIDALGVASHRTPLVANTYAILRTRSSSVDAEILLPEAGQAVELRVLPEFTAKSARYRVRLARMSADDSLEPFAELGGLVPASDRFMSIYLSGAQLKPGLYRLTIGGDSDADATESAFVVRVTPPR